MRSTWKVLGVLGVCVATLAFVPEAHGVPSAADAVTPSPVATTPSPLPLAPSPLPGLTALSQAEMAVIKGDGDALKWSTCGALGIFVGVMSGSPWNGLVMNGLCHYTWNKLASEE